MPHFNARDATFRGCRCHTWTTTKCGIGLAEVWHWRRSGVAFTPLRCGVYSAQVWRFGGLGAVFCELHECVASFQKAVASGRGGASSGMGQPR